MLIKRTSFVTFALVAFIGMSKHPAISYADEGSGHSGGGGEELFFHSLASQIGDWLSRYQADGTLAKKLQLAPVSAADVVNAFETALRNTPDVKFISQGQLEQSCRSGDAGACLLIKSPTRICVNHGSSSRHADGKNFIRCNSSLFNSASGDLQFSIVFHEYLGVAGVEKNGSSDISSYSQYPISKYVMKYAMPKTVIRYELGEQKSEYPSLNCTAGDLGCYPNFASAFAKAAPTSDLKVHGASWYCSEFNARENGIIHPGDPAGAGRIHFMSENSNIYVSLPISPRLSKVLVRTTQNGHVFADISYPRTRGETARIYFRVLDHSLLYEVIRNPAMLPKYEPAAISESGASVEAYGICN